MNIEPTVPTVNLNVAELENHVRYWCSLTTDELFAALQTIPGFSVVDYGIEGKGKYAVHNRYAYRPGLRPDSPLLVCHADTVLGSRAYEYDPETSIVTSAELDDRLGLACITYAIASGLVLGSCAVLVCDAEEVGQSTAELFAGDVWPTPNWLMEFDRRGSDVVTYCYHNATWHSLLESVGFTIGSGSFSDISSMEKLCRSGVNVGVAYHSEHSLKCNAMLAETLVQLGRAELFCRQFERITMRHDYRVSYAKTGSLSSYRYSTDAWDNWDDDDRFYGKVTGAVIVDNPRDCDDDDYDVLELPVGCESCDCDVDLDDAVDWQGHTVCAQCYHDLFFNEKSEI